MSVIIGIDPGKQGAAVALAENGGVLGVVDFAVAIEGFQQFLADYSDRAVVWIEKVHASPQMGLASAFKFGVQFGFVCASCEAHGLPVNFVTPMGWQKPLMIPARSKVGAHRHKALLKQAALEMFPGVPWTLRTCDAALIAGYGLRHTK